MAALTDNLGYRWRTTLSRSRVPEFFSWWGRKLREGLPQRLREVLEHPQPRLLVSVVDKQLRLDDVGDDKDEPVVVVALNEGKALAASKIRTALERYEQRPETVFAIPAHAVLRKELTFPSAAEENLTQVLAYEMDRHTPFSADKVYFDYRVLQRDTESKTIRVELYVARREQVDRVLKLVDDRDLVLHGVDVADERGPMGVNLLPATRRAPLKNNRLRLNLLLGLVFVVLLYVVMWQSLAVKERALDRYRERVSAVFQEASAVTELKTELETARDGATFLVQRRNDHPVLINVLRDLTRALPDDTWVQRLQVKEDKIIVNGQAPNATALISILEQVPCLASPSFPGSITQDPQTGKERFNIEVMVTSCDRGAPQQEGEDAATAAL